MATGVTGTCKWFNDEKGFGFITQDNGPDVFVHYRSIRQHGRERRTLGAGMALIFDVEQTDRGLAAKDVRPLDQ